MEALTAVDGVAQHLAAWPHEGSAGAQQERRAGEEEGKGQGEEEEEVCPGVVMRRSAGAGRFLVAARDFRRGDEVVKDRPLVVSAALDGDEEGALADTLAEEWSLEHDARSDARADTDMHTHTYTPTHNP